MDESNDSYMDRLTRLQLQHRYVTTSFPGQPIAVMEVPAHLMESLNEGRIIPFYAWSTIDELDLYLPEDRLPL